MNAHPWKWLVVHGGERALNPETRLRLTSTATDCWLEKNRAMPLKPLHGP